MNKNNKIYSKYYRIHSLEEDYKTTKEIFTFFLLTIFASLGFFLSFFIIDIITGISYYETIFYLTFSYILALMAKIYDEKLKVLKLKYKLLKYKLINGGKK